LTPRTEILEAACGLGVDRPTRDFHLLDLFVVDAEIGGDHLRAPR
jgi:hypothetical protein